MLVASRPVMAPKTGFGPTEEYYGGRPTDVRAPGGQRRFAGGTAPPSFRPREVSNGPVAIEQEVWERVYH